MLYQLPHDGALDEIAEEDLQNEDAFRDYCSQFSPEEFALWLVKQRRNLDAEEAALKAEVEYLKSRIAAVGNKREKLTTWQVRPFLALHGKDAGKTPLGTFYTKQNKPKEIFDASKIAEWPAEIRKDRDIIEVSWSLKKLALQEKYPDIYKKLPGYSEEEQKDSIGFRAK